MYHPIICFPIWNEIRRNEKTAAFCIFFFRKKNKNKQTWPNMTLKFVFHMWGVMRRPLPLIGQVQIWAYDVISPLSGLSNKIIVLNSNLPIKDVICHFENPNKSLESTGNFLIVANVYLGLCWHFEQFKLSWANTILEQFNSKYQLLSLTDSILEKFKLSWPNSILEIFNSKYLLLSFCQLNFEQFKLSWANSIIENLNSKY